MDLTQQQHDEILKRVQNRINEFLGSDVEKLSKLSELHDEWDAKRKEIEQSLSLTGDEVPSKVGKIVKEIDTTCGELSANCQQVSLTLAEISKATCSTDDVYLLLEGNFDKIGRLTHAHAYLSILDYIEQLSNRMEGYVAGRDVYTARAIDEYRKLCELCVKVNKTSCAHLRTYLVDTLKYWHSILKKDIVEDFVTCMKNVQWPVVSSNNLLSSPSADSLSKFQHGLSRLLQIVIPCGNMRDRYGALSFSVNDWKEFLVQSKQSFKKRYYAKSPSDVSRDDFDILRTLGSGSFGRVLLARRKSDNHYFAIKVLDKAKVVKTKQVEHTLNEKQILQAVRCPFTVHLEQFFQDNLYLFFVLPLVVGGEMFTHLRKLGKFHESVTRFYAAQVILGLEYLHFLDLIYRDLKPENLLIDHIGYLKITDFGFCKILKKRTYTVCGTPEYLAPEIILRKGYGHSVDWWTLGVLIFEMAAGYPPFTAKDTMKLYEKIIACKYAFPSNFTSDVKDIIRNILQVDTSKRFGNLKGGADDIKHHKFFKSIQWLPLANKKLVSPFIPHVSGPSDVSNFQRCSEEPLQVSSQNKYAAEFADF